VEFLTNQQKKKKERKTR